MRKVNIRDIYDENLKIINQNMRQDRADQQVYMGLKSQLVCSYNTQRNDSRIINGVIQSNPLALDTLTAVEKVTDISPKNSESERK